jgi:AraC-like DNA-binding protein
MTIPIEILLLTSGIGAVQSALFSVYLFTVRKGRQLANMLLAFLLLAFAIRMTKSVTYIFADDHYVPQLLQNLGYSANLAILPLLWLYLKAFLHKDYHFQWQKDGVHLLPAVFGILLSPFLTSYFWMNLHGYTISLLAMGVYLPVCFFSIYKNFSKLNKPQQIWIVALAAGIAIVWIGYTANFVLHLIPYITAPVMFSFVIYFMTYLALQQHNMHASKNHSSGFQFSEVDRCFERLQHVMVSQRLYKDYTLTLPKVAKHVGVSSHMLSATINSKAEQNFSDYINTYRIREAQQLLTDPGNSHQKIAAIAFETGFNSLSSFNTAFKKTTSTTPSEYRKKFLNNKD